MSLKFALLACLCIAPGLHAHELQTAAQGLAVSIESMEGMTGINGLPVVVARAVGPAAPELARNLIDRWHESLGRNSVRLDACCGWQFASVVRNEESRVIQWRSTAAGGELIWSSARLSSSIQLPPPTRFPLLRECAWTTPVHGRAANRRFSQQSAYCDIEPHVALERTINRLAGEGWRWHRLGNWVIQAERRGVQVELVAGRSPPLPGAIRRGTALMLVETNPVKAEGS